MAVRSIDGLCRCVLDGHYWGSGELAKNKALARHLRSAGLAVELSSKGADIRGTIGSKRFCIEGKDSLTSKVVCDRLIGQVTGYLNEGYDWVVVVVYREISEELYKVITDYARRRRGRVQLVMVGQRAGRDQRSRGIKLW